MIVLYRGIMSQGQHYFTYFDGLRQFETQHTANPNEISNGKPEGILSA